MRLLRKHSAQLIRYGSVGHYNEAGKWEEGQEPEPITIRCNIQPYTKAEVKVPLPEGVMEKDTKVVYTDEHLTTASEADEVVADKLVIDGKRYVVFEAAEWDGAVRLRFHEVLCIREDKL